MDSKHIEIICGLNATKEHNKIEVIPDIERVARVAKSTQNTIETK